MSFSNYKEIEQVQIEFNIRWKEENFIKAKTTKISQEFLKEYHFKLEVIDYRASEAARTETLIFPILLEVYKDYHDKFSLWIQKSISAGKKLSGTPDYLVSVKSELGKTVLGIPLVAVVEAKKNDFDTGWGQCLAELVALQKINNNENMAVYGIVTDGERWEFGKLEKNIFFENKTTFTNEDLPQLFGALHFIFQAFQ